MQTIKVVREDKDGQPLIENGIPYVLVGKTKEFLYTIEEDGNGMKWKIANCMHPDNCELMGTKIIRSIDKGRADPDVSPCRVDDNKTGIIYAVKEGVDPVTKQFIFKKFNLVALQELHLAEFPDRQMWMVVQRHSCMEGNPYPGGKRPYFRVEDREADAQAKLLKFNQRDRASNLVKGMKKGELVDTAIRCGITSNYSSEDILRVEVLSWLEKDTGGISNARKFNESYDNTNRQAVDILNRCKTVALITIHPMDGIIWKETQSLGQTEAAAINYMNTHLPLMQVMDWESKEKNAMYQEFASDEEKKTAISISEETPVVKPASEFMTNQEVKETMSRVSEKEKALDAKLNSLDEKLKMLDDKLADKTPEAAKAVPPVRKTADDFELSDLQVKAAELGFKDAMENKNKQKLFDFIQNKLRAAKVAADKAKADAELAAAGEKTE